MKRVSQARQFELSQQQLKLDIQYHFQHYEAIEKLPQKQIPHHKILQLLFLNFFLVKFYFSKYNRLSSFLFPVLSAASSYFYLIYLHPMKSPKSQSLPVLSVLDPQACGVNNFIFEAGSKQLDIWHDTKLDRFYEEHRVYRFNLEDLLLYQERKERYDDWLGIHFVSVKDEPGSRYLKVFAERVLVRLSQVLKMEFEEGLLMLAKVLSGFQSIYKRFGSLNITSKMVCINDKGKVKVWMNQDHYRNGKTKSEAIGNQRSMVSQILEMVESRISDSPAFRQYKFQKHKQLKLASFSSAISFIKRALLINSIDQNTQITLSKLKINKQTNALKLKFERKSGLRRSNRHQLTLREEADPSSKQNGMAQNLLLQKTRSVKYFKSPSSETRSRSKSVVSERLSFSARARTDSLGSSRFRLLSPKSLLKNENTKYFKASESTISQLNRSSANQQRPPTKFHQRLQNSLKNDLNIKFVKQSVIIKVQETEQKDDKPVGELFKGLGLFHTIKDLKKSQYMEDHGPYTPPPTSLLQSFPRSSSALARSFYNMDIKEIIEQEYDS